MVTRRRYAILGTGALGGFYGARLCRAGLDVHFLLHSDFEHVREHGLVIASKDGDFTLPKVQAYGSVTTMPRCDVVLVALKTTQNHLLSELLPPVLDREAVVVMMQNGLGCEEEAARVAEGHEILGGLCFLCSNKLGPGQIHHLDYGAVRLARFHPEGKPAGSSQALRAVAADFERAGVAVDVAEDLLAARFQKLVWNVPMSGLSVLLDADTRALMEDLHSRAVAEALMRDVAAGAQAFGRTISEPFIEKMLTMTAAMTPYRASMKIDYDEGRPMELEAIYGNPVRAVKARKGAMPLVEALYHQLKFLDARGASSRR